MILTPTALCITLPNLKFLNYQNTFPNIGSLIELERYSAQKHIADLNKSFQEAHEEYIDEEKDVHEAEHNVARAREEYILATNTGKGKKCYLLHRIIDSFPWILK